MIKGKGAILEPREATKQELLLVHTEEYLESLNVRACVFYDVIIMLS